MIKTVKRQCSQRREVFCGHCFYFPENNMVRLWEIYGEVLFSDAIYIFNWTQDYEKNEEELLC